MADSVRAGAPRVLIVRLSSLGDVMHGLPVLCALRAHRPDAFLAWVVEEWASELLRDHPALDRLYTVPRDSLHAGRSGWRTVARTLRRLRRQLRADGFDRTVDIQGLTRSALVARVSGARRRIGFDGADGRQHSRRLNNLRVTPSAAHVIDRNLELLRPLGIVQPDVEFGLPVDPEAHAVVGRWLSERSLEPAGLAVLSVGASVPARQWPSDRFAALAGVLRERYDLRSLLLWGSASERDMAERAAASSEGAATLAIRFSHRELVALFRTTSVYVGPDSGLLHMAVAAGAACVGLHGPSLVARNGAYRMADSSLQSADGTMASIDVERVVAACDIALRSSARQGRAAAHR